MEQRIVAVLINYRFLLSALSLLVTLFLAQGASKLFFDGDYKSFFDNDDPQLIAHEALEREYTKSESVMFLIKPESGDLFTRDYLELIKNLTEELWQTPYSIRVDSLSNYQHSEAAADELKVQDLIPELDNLNQQRIKKIRNIALNEKELVNRFISPDGKTTLLNIALELPETAKDASVAEQREQLKIKGKAYEEVAHFTQLIAQQIRNDHPELTVHRMGLPILNQNFSYYSTRDTSTLIPAMYLFILIALGLFFRSIGCVISSCVVIGLSSMAAVGAAGWIGYTINSVTVIAPIIILTIAVCDSVHIMAIYQRHLGSGTKPIEAMRESLRINLQPVVLTSVTTAVGFFTLNFAESPLSRSLGNICGFGVLYAMLISLFLMPALVTLIVKKPRKTLRWENAVGNLGGLIVKHKKASLVIPLAVALLLISLVPLNTINNDPINFFKVGTPYRDAAIFSQDNLPGIVEINFSLSCGTTECINEPAYLSMVEKFVQWAEQQPEVVHAATYVDVAKRLNKNMHSDDSAWYKLPDSRELSAQYQLLYELSLPFGLDLNNQINFNKDATRVNMWLKQILTTEIIEFETRAYRWLEDNSPEMATHGASVQMMFSIMTIRDIYSMIYGVIFALVGVTLTILIATRSLKYGLLSMIPNAFPAAMALGIWGVIISEVNGAVTLIFSVTLGLVVDNTVHFISKYQRARAKGDTSERAVNYAFGTVGSALVITAVVLTAGFSLLTLSKFNINAYLGGLTAITVIIALAFDLLMLPALLLLIDGKADKSKTALTTK